MTGQFILAHDLGTTGNKASLYDSEGKVLASSFYGYGTEYPDVNWAEQNPSDWWQAVCISTQQLLSEAKVQAREVACIAFSGQMMGCVAVDQAANPLRKAIIWADQRAVKEANYLIDRVGWEEAYHITGHRASPSYSGAKILWVQNHQPEIFAQTHKFLHAKDFIVAKLTGNFVTDYSDASGMNLYDLMTKNWSDSILAAIELDRTLLPEPHPSTDVVGEVTPQAAEEVGLAPGTPVVIGGGDGPCAAAGAGVVSEGRAYNYVGSSSWIALASEKPIYDPDYKTFTFEHVVPGMFTPTGTMQTAGASYQWTRDQLCPVEIQAAETLQVSPYELMNLEAENSPVGANGLIFLPYLIGERSPHWNPRARGAFIGLTIRHTRADMIRAVLEGVTMNLRVILDAFRAQDVQIETIRLIGGGARGRFWNQIMADVYGMLVHRLAIVEEATSMGAALTGGVGIGLYPGFSMIETMNQIAETIAPDPVTQTVYQQNYAVFEAAYQALAPVYDMMAEI
jgi:xylulokinase